MKKIHYLFIILALFSFTYSQNYHWPTIGSKAMSSNFGEYRDGGYHMVLILRLLRKLGGQYMLLMMDIYQGWLPIFQDTVKDYI